MLVTMNQRSVTLFCLAFALLSADGAPVTANTFSCKDSSGKFLSGSSPPDGCVGEICEAKPNGAEECRGPPETDEQRSEREAKEKKERDCRKKIRDGLLDAYAFLDRYPRSEDFEDERDREIVKTLRRIEEAKQRRDAQRHKVAELEKKAEFYGPKHPMPDELRADIDFNRKLLGDEKIGVSQSEKEMIQLNEKYDRMLKRREYLLQHGVEPVSCDG